MPVASGVFDIMATSHFTPASPGIAMQHHAVNQRGARILPLVLAALLAFSLAGCAAYKARAKCGAAGCAGDAEITQQVQQIFTQHTEFQNQLYVKTIDHVVYLTGEAATGFQKDSAESLARGVPGVQKVINNIYVNNPR
jgi:osmotically-inducible protein OsmY